MRGGRGGIEMLCARERKESERGKRERGELE